MPHHGGVFGVEIVAGQQIIQRAAAGVCPQADLAPFLGAAVRRHAEVRRQSIGIVAVQSVVDHVAVRQRQQRVAVVEDVLHRDAVDGGHIRRHTVTEVNVEDNARLFHLLRTE